jgi:hypothetical protein
MTEAVVQYTPEWLDDPEAAVPVGDNPDHHPTNCAHASLLIIIVKDIHLPHFLIAKHHQVSPSITKPDFPERPQTTKSSSQTSMATTHCTLRGYLHYYIGPFSSFTSNA